MKLDFNSTSFSHPKSGDQTLSNRDKGIRDFWIEHTIRSRKIADEMGKQLGDKACHNLWIHDGSKDLTVDRYLYRSLLKDSLDKIFAVKCPNVKDAVESKVFGVGLESYTVGSHEFYMAMPFRTESCARSTWDTSTRPKRLTTRFRPCCSSLRRSCCT